MSLSRCKRRKEREKEWLCVYRLLIGEFREGDDICWVVLQLVDILILNMPFFRFKR